MKNGTVSDFATLFATFTSHNVLQALFEHTSRHSVDNVRQFQAHISRQQRFADLEQQRQEAMERTTKRDRFAHQRDADHDQRQQ